jgi:hypothetical protein
MRQLRASLFAIALVALGPACGGADEPEDTIPATTHKPDVEVGAGGEVGGGDEGARANATGEVKAGDVGGKAGAGADVNVDDETVKAGASGSAQGTTDADRDGDDPPKQQPLPAEDPHQPNPEQPQQPPQPEQPETGTTP